MPAADSPATPAIIRLAEVVATLSLATDLGTGQPLERALRTCFLSMRLAQALALSAAEQAAVYYAALLRFVGCTADMQLLSTLFDDEQQAQARVAALELLPSVIVTQILRHAGAGRPLPARLQKIVASLRLGAQSAYESGVAHCEVAQMVAGRLGLGEAVTTPLGQIFERWDGRGIPGRARKTGLTVAIRVVHVAQDAEAFYRSGGCQAAVHIVQKRSGGYYDPAIAQRFCQAGQPWLEALETERLWEQVMDLEPQPWPRLSEAELDNALATMADFTDIRSVNSYGHSRAVGALAQAAALSCGLAPAEAAQIRRAGYVHDIGRAAISLNIWDKAGPLTSAEWDRVRLYPYYTERVLARVPRLAEIGAIAAAHRERLDGSGYHRGLAAARLGLPSRLLAAADAYQSQIEQRAYRPARTAAAASAELRRQVPAGQLDAAAVEAVLAQVGGAHRRPAAPAGLSEREIEILRLVAGSHSNRDIAARLSLSPRTVEHHVEHIYNKLGVSTRIAASLYAMEHGLAAADDPHPS